MVHERELIIFRLTFCFQEKLAQLSSELSGKRAILSTATEVVREMTERIAANAEKKNGLCIRSVLYVSVVLCMITSSKLVVSLALSFDFVFRCLNKQLLQSVFTFLGAESAVGLVSKYWHLTVSDNLPSLKQASTSDN